MSKELIQKLRPYVTTFSPAIDSTLLPKDEVIIGGKLINVLNLKDLLHDAISPDFRSEGVYLTLDDGLGEILVCVGPRAYDLFVKEHGALEVGQVFLAGGVVHHLDTTHQQPSAGGHIRTFDNHRKKTIRILAYQLAPLPKQKEMVD